MYKLNNLDIEAITDFMFVQEQALPADATIVLGTSLWQRPLKKVLELYHGATSGTIVFSGGYNRKIQTCEAFEMLAHWKKLGLPTSTVLADFAATNTRENIENSKTLLQSNGLNINDATINLVCINYHMKRAVETFRQVIGQTAKLGCVSYPSKYCDPNAWHLNPRGQMLILNEALKIKRYLPETIIPDHILDLLKTMEADLATSHAGTAHS